MQTELSCPKCGRNFLQRKSRPELEDSKRLPQNFMIGIIIPTTTFTICDFSAKSLCCRCNLHERLFAGADQAKPGNPRSISRFDLDGKSGKSTDCLTGSSRFAIPEIHFAQTGKCTSLFRNRILDESVDDGLDHHFAVRPLQRTATESLVICMKCLQDSIIKRRPAKRFLATNFLRCHLLLLLLMK